MDIYFIYDYAHPDDAEYQVKTDEELGGVFPSASDLGWSNSGYVFGFWGSESGDRFYPGQEIPLSESSLRVGALWEKYLGTDTLNSIRDWVNHRLSEAGPLFSVDPELSWTTDTQGNKILGLSRLKNSEYSDNAVHVTGSFSEDSSDHQGSYSFAEGENTLSSGQWSHSEGKDTVSSGNWSHAQGLGTIANHAGQTALGEYNIVDTNPVSSISRGDYIEIVGNGSQVNVIITSSSLLVRSTHSTSASIVYELPSGTYEYTEIYDDEQSRSWYHIIDPVDGWVTGSSYIRRSTAIKRSNARTLDWNGNEYLSGDLDVEGAITSNGDNVVTDDKLNWKDITSSVSVYPSDALTHMTSFRVITNGRFVNVCGHGNLSSTHFSVDLSGYEDGSYIPGSDVPYWGSGFCASSGQIIPCLVGSGLALATIGVPLDSDASRVNRLYVRTISGSSLTYFTFSIMYPVLSSNLSSSSGGTGGHETPGPGST